MSDRIEVLRLSMMARGDADALRRFQDALRQQERNGDIRIVFMDDEIAKIENLNPAWARVLSGHNGRAS